MERWRLLPNTIASVYYCFYCIALVLSKMTPFKGTDAHFNKRLRPWTSHLNFMHRKIEIEQPHRSFENQINKNKISLLALLSLGELDPKVTKSQHCCREVPAFTGEWSLCQVIRGLVSKFQIWSYWNFMPITAVPACECVLLWCYWLHGRGQGMERKWPKAN